MHYKNGREARNGDKVALITDYVSVIGILYDATPGQDYCNGKLAPIAPNDPCPNLKECLHLDDVKAAISAALGQVKEWMLQQDERARVQIREHDAVTDRDDDETFTFE